MTTANTLQLYAENTEIKYPLLDYDETALASDVLLNLVLNIPTGIEPASVKLTNLVCTDKYVFISIEAGTTPIAQLFQRNPEAFKIYNMDREGRVGCASVVFGPGISRAVKLTRVAYSLDPRCMFPDQLCSTAFKLDVNGFTYDMPPVLRIATTDTVKLLDMERLVGGTTRRTLSITRNDIAFDADTLKTGLATSIPGDLLYTINGVSPDSNGAFTLALAPEDLANETAIYRTVQTDSTLGGLTITTGGDHVPVKHNRVAITDIETINGTTYSAKVYFENTANVDQLNTQQFLLDGAEHEYLITSWTGHPSTFINGNRVRVTTRNFAGAPTANAGVGVFGSYIYATERQPMKCCDDAYKRLLDKIKKGIEGHGTLLPLPLDNMVNT